MRLRLLAVAPLALLAGLVLSPRPDAFAGPPVTGYPDSIAALGDSITRATNSQLFGDNVENSWATGASPAVDPYYARLLAAHPPIAGNRYNDAVAGARMTHLDGQAAAAVSQGAELVFIFMGSNDVCTSSEASMTSVATFQAQFEAALATLSAGLPDSRLAVLSIPDIYNLWAILKDNATARGVWDFADICQSMLVNPLSTAPADVQRRANVRQRNIEYNDVLHDVCAQYAHCKFDDYLGFNTAFTPAHVSDLDYFHPSIAGQALIAQLAWDSAFDFSDVTPPVSGSMGAAASGGAMVSLSASDASGVNGIEYQAGGPWQTATAPFFTAEGTLLTWRAVDANGNSEASHSCRVGTWSWPAADDDCDGYATAHELNLGTEPADACGFTAGGTTPSENWPPDLVPTNTITIQDVLAMKPVFNGVSPRLDFVPSGGTVTIQDVLSLKPFFNKTCTP
jgi:lysophospholipase L1-like esterase